MALSLQSAQLSESFPSGRSPRIRQWEPEIDSGAPASGNGVPEMVSERTGTVGCCRCFQERFPGVCLEMLKCVTLLEYRQIP
jgi:hypothetical protein